MKKKKSPYYGLIWLLIWTAALAIFWVSGIFTLRELLGLSAVWLVLAVFTVYHIFRHHQLMKKISG